MAERFSAVGSNLDGCDLTERGFFFSTGWRRRAQGAAVVARRKARWRRDRLNENMRALAKTDEEFMVSLRIRFSSALEGQGAPATSNGGGGVGSSWGRGFSGEN